MHAATGDPPIPIHQKILEDEHAQLDHIDDVLSRCRHIVEIVRAYNDEDIFLEGSDVWRVLDAIMTEAHGIDGR